MEFEKEEEAPSSPSSMAASPGAQYFNSFALSVSILCVLEFEVPISIDDSQTFPLLKDVFLPINPRFSSIMVEDKEVARKWKRVEVNLKDHVKVPVFPKGLSPALYQDHFNNYFSKIATDQLPQNRPLWEIHIIKYPATNASGHVIFKLHHALGDGYSLMGALLSSTQRADNPSIPLTFPSCQSQSQQKENGEKVGNIFRHVGRIFSGVFDTLLDFGESIVKSGLDDDRTPIHSGTEGLEFQPKVTTKMTFSLDQLKQIKDTLNVTINDVIVGIIYLGTRMYMKVAAENNNDELGSNNTETIGLVLLNTRAIGCYKSVSEMLKKNAEMPWGNRFAFLHVPVPQLTDDESSNLLDSILKTHKMIKRKRNSSAVYFTDLLLDTMRKFRGFEQQCHELMDKNKRQGFRIHRSPTYWKEINTSSNAVKQGPSTGKATIGGSFNLIDHNGNAVTDRDFLGNWTVVYFGFMHCPHICPDKLQKLADAVHKIKEKAGIEIVPVFISVDLERDTVEQVREYVKDASSDWNCILKMHDLYIVAYDAFMSLNLFFLYLYECPTISPKFGWTTW